MKKAKALFILIPILILIIIFCSVNKNTDTNNIDSVRENCINYLSKQNYKIYDENSDDGFSIKSKKENQKLCIDFRKANNDNSQYEIIFNSTIKEYTDKYKSIDYNELSKLSKILGVKISSVIIKKACEDKRDYYDTSNDDYTCFSTEIMSKIYRVGFWENPIIEYKLTHFEKYSETVTISNF